jgi:hypothetical protein
MSNKLDKQCRKLAKQLPVVYAKAKKTIPTKGSSLIKAGTHRDKEGYDIIPNRVYNITVELNIPINHADRIKVQYKAKGEKGVAQYISWAKSAAKWQQNAVDKIYQQQQSNKNIYQKVKSFICKILKRTPETMQVKQQLPSIRA